MYQSTNASMHFSIVDSISINKLLNSTFILKKIINGLIANKFIFSKLFKSVLL
jgi:hypothetical protein